MIHLLEGIVFCPEILFYVVITEKYDLSLILSVIGLASVDVDETLVELLTKETHLITSAARLT